MITIDNDQTAHYDSLRSSAQGLLPLEAATELLIRSGFAQDWRVWVSRDPDDHDAPHIEFPMIPSVIAAKSSGERRLLLIAASLGAHGVRISLEDCIPRLDSIQLRLVLAALAHAQGSKNLWPA